MTGRVDHIAGQTFHGRKGETQNAFRYAIDYVLVDAEAETPQAPWLFGRNKPRMFSLQDQDHGGAPRKGRGPVWAREVLAQNQIDGIARIELLAQPRVLGHVFNPVSFWLCRTAQGGLRAVIVEVSNTYGDRHSYLCVHPDRRDIQPSDRLSASKVFHVSPFQPVAGEYCFRFDITQNKVGIWIDYTRDQGGVLATLTGDRKPLTTLGLFGALIRRPLGARRVLALIHWQALRLWWKGAAFRNRPAPPNQDVT